jgi:hypothetical protein
VARKGDSVLLVAATVFVGYLFVTRRLQAVFDVLKGPAPGAAPEVSTPGATAGTGPGTSDARAPWQHTPPIGGEWTPSWWPGSENQRRQNTPTPVPADAGYPRGFYVR